VADPESAPKASIPFPAFLITAERWVFWGRRIALGSGIACILLGALCILLGALRIGEHSGVQIDPFGPFGPVSPVVIAIGLFVAILEYPCAPLAKLFNFLFPKYLHRGLFYSLIGIPAIFSVVTSVAGAGFSVA